MAATVAGVLAGFSQSQPELIALISMAGLFAAVAVIIEATQRRSDVEPMGNGAPRAVQDGEFGVDLFQLPADIHDFVGREGLLTRLDDLLTGSSSDKAVRMVRITGQPGVGKTALAVHTGHLLRHHYPDGQLYVDLRGAEARALDPREVLAGFLRELGVARAAVPEGLEERARLFRARLSGRRVLVILDNAADEAQVRALLPGSPGCAVLITSRSSLAGLVGAPLVEVDVLGLAQAAELLRKIVADERVAEAPALVTEIVQLCGLLPLAVRIAGARLAAKRHWSLAAYTSRLRDERLRLGELQAGDQAVRAGFALSYRALDEHERRVFHAAGVLDGPDLTAWIVTAMTGIPEAETERILERLVDIHLMTVGRTAVRSPARYRFHDLLRVYSRERLSEDAPQGAREAALAAALRAYTVVAERAYALVEPGEVRLDTEEHDWWPANDPDLLATFLRDPERWFAVERPCLVAVLEQAFDAGMQELACRLALPLYGAFTVGAHWHTWQRVFGKSLQTARELGSERLEAQVLLRLGDVYKNSGRVDGPGGIPDPDREDVSAAAFLERSLAIFRRLGDRQGEVAVLRRLGGVYRDLGRYDRSRECYEAGLAAAAALPSSDAVRAYLLRGFGALLRIQGEYDRAAACFDEALMVFGDMGAIRGELGALRGLGETRLRQRRWDDAEYCFTRHLIMDRKLQDRHGEAHSLRGLGEVYAGRGKNGLAIRYLSTCLPLFREIGHRASEAETLVILGRVQMREGRPAAARKAWRRATEIYQELGLLESARPHLGAGPWMWARALTVRPMRLLARLARLDRAIGSHAGDGGGRE
ncbi:tetratricopeptide repeat protein [Thermopolyspora sp. NPDC052614]|uniref:ATP-binding protein n=1 Tax=Thermopolyspora sp. NPDC052614 TaxID=3155682 RepID=UPI003444BAB2